MSSFNVVLTPAVSALLNSPLTRVEASPLKLISADAGDAYDSAANIAASDIIFFMCVLR